MDLQTQVSQHLKTLQKRSSSNLPALSEDYEPHAKQIEFHDALKTHSVVFFNAGRGAGKTTAGATHAIWEAVKLQPGERGIIVAPTYPMLRDASMSEFFKWLEPAWIRSWNKSEKNLLLTNGSEIAFRSADNPDSLRGPNRAWMWFDEPRNMRSREAFDIVYAQLRVGASRAWLTSTPAGIFHWLYELFVANPIPGSTYITARSADNPHLPPDYVQKLQAMYTGAFAAQELDAQFVSFEGVVFDNFTLNDNVTTDAEYNPDADVFWFVDDGYAHGEGPGTQGYHPRVILLAQQTAQGGLNFFDEYCQTLQLEEQSIDEVLSWPYKRPTMAVVDSSAPQLRARLSERNILNAGGTHRVTEGIKVMRRFICDGNGVRLMKIHPRCKHLIRELQMYRYDDASRVVESGERKPLKIDDHTIDAARMGCYNFR